MEKIYQIGNQSLIINSRNSPNLKTIINYNFESENDWNDQDIEQLQDRLFPYLSGGPMMIGLPAGYLKVTRGDVGATMAILKQFFEETITMEEETE